MDIAGKCDHRFLGIKNLLSEQVNNGSSLGSAFAVYREGKALIDLYGGYANIKKTKLWDKDTIAPVHSVGKGIVSLCLTLLISRGQLDLDANVSEYWPEFDKNNKKNIKIRTLFSHQAGLYGWRKEMFNKDFYDWDYCVNLLANQKPFHNPGEETCYHAKTIGFLAGEIIKRITNKTIGQFINDEFVKHKSLSCYIGTPLNYHCNISETINSKIDRNSANKIRKPDKYLNISFNNPISDRNLYKKEKWIISEIPSLNCYANASSLAQIYDSFNGENLSESLRIALKNVLVIESSRVDFVMRMPIKWSPVGFIIDGGKLFGKCARSFGHTGSGGSVAFADPENRISVAYTTNTISSSIIDDKRALNLVTKLYDLI